MPVTIKCCDFYFFCTKQRSLKKILDHYNDNVRITSQKYLLLYFIFYPGTRTPASAHDFLDEYKGKIRNEMTRIAIDVMRDNALNDEEREEIFRLNGINIVGIYDRITKSGNSSTGHTTGGAGDN